MQSAALTLSPPAPFLKSLPSRPRAFGLRFDPIRFPTSSSSSRVSGVVTASAVPGLSASSLPRRSWCLGSPTPRPWSGLPYLGSDREARSLEARATSVPEAADGGGKSGGLGRTLELGLLFGLWYLFNIYFNIYNKQVGLLSKLLWVPFFVPERVK